jgi:hypothetical protein
MAFCISSSTVRILRDEIVAAKSAPAKARSGALRVVPRTIKPPLAPTVRTRKFSVDGTAVKGVECKLNGTAVTWPSASTVNWQFAPQVKKITWHSVIPPLYSVTGPASNPIGEVSTSTRTFRACAPEPMDNFMWIRNGLWAEAVIHSHPGGAVSHTTWHLYAGTSQSLCCWRPTFRCIRRQFSDYAVGWTWALFSGKTRREHCHVLRCSRMASHLDH